MTLPSIAESSVLDDDIGSQAFLEKLLESRGLDPAILTAEDIDEGDSDIEQQEYQMELQKVFLSSPAPSSPSKEVLQGRECMVLFPIYFISITRLTIFYRPYQH